MNIVIIIMATFVILYGWGMVAYYYGFYKRNPL
jgi:hypothetical protein